MKRAQKNDSQKKNPFEWLKFLGGAYVTATIRFMLTIGCFAGAAEPITDGYKINE